ncbi:MAG: AIR synthase family protein [Lachnospiraceae bacterium]
MDKKLKIGKLSETSLQRSILKQLHGNRQDVLVKPGVGMDYAAIQMISDQNCILSTETFMGDIAEIEDMLVTRTWNNLACSGARPVGIMLAILLPEDFSEEELKGLIQKIDLECSRSGTQVLGGHTEVTQAVNRPVITVTGIGKTDQNQNLPTGKVKPGMDILLTKSAGIEGTVLLAKRRESELETRFSNAFLSNAIKMEELLSVQSEADIALKAGACAMHDVSKGGIFGALWEFANSSEIGIEIELRKIPMRQETVEICEFFGLNPYEILGGGALLIAAEDGNRLVLDLHKAGIPVTIIGKATNSKDRVLLNGEDVRYLDLPKSDEIHRILE